MGRVVRGKEKRKVGRWWSGGREMDRRGGGKEAERKVEGREQVDGWMGVGGAGVELSPAQHLLQSQA